MLKIYLFPTVLTVLISIQMIKSQNLPSQIGSSLGIASAGSIQVGKIMSACPSKRCDTGYSDVPYVFLFEDTLTKAISDSEVLTELFNVTGSTAQEFSDFIYKYAVNFFTQQGSPYAEDIACKATRPITKYFDNISAELLIRIYIKAFSKYIYAEGALTADNAVTLALSYASDLVASAQRTMTCDPISKFTAIEDGCADFLFSLNLASAGNGYDIAFYYANEFILAAIESACNGS
ncbi:hypothetical protein CEXT_84001 [Caerostris extrusa]|uniref:Uncharacterized protein n=1 Tax=Caerostris extrusa TaxID=172846 RepID=A0AAV4PKM5_CAEEX|nr:hypothetical protein CEXT_84001 [Caerostris extrusa]